MPERISQRVRESGVFKHEDFPVTQEVVDTPIVTTEPPKFFGGVKMGIVLNPSDLNRKLLVSSATAVNDQYSK